jgi:hypothetical protein
MWLDQARQFRWLWAVVTHEVWRWAVQFWNYTEKNCWVYDGCAWKEPGSRVILLLP